MSNPPNESIFDTWTVYDQILDHNFMFHRELYTDLRSFLAEHYANRAVSLLDLGCGSARHLAPAIKNGNVVRYLGYDLSATALSEAGQNLEGYARSVELRHGDLLEALKSCADSFNLIFSSFALHHLGREDKVAFFRYAHNRLEEQGSLLLIDVMREESEDLPIYLDRYCNWIRSEWSIFQPQALDAICQHVRLSDYPEKPSQLNALASRAGFAEGTEISRYLWHRFWCFKKERH